MKTRFTLLSVAIPFLLALNWNNAISQSKSKFPSSGVQSADGCLACPGSEWNNASFITQYDNQFASTVMTANGFCFQTVCYYSRGLIGSAFGFNIPSASTIKGIQVRINRKAGMAQSIRDSSVRLMKGFTFVGTEKKANAYWPTVSKTRSYGGASDLWGSAWTPGDINSEDFGIWLKCYNQGAASPEAFVDYMRVTIYYAGEFGVEKQTMNYDFTSSPLSIYPNPATQNATLTFFCPESGMVTQSIFNMEGKKILSQRYEMEKGQVINQLDVSALPAGNYFIRCEMKGRTWTGNLIKE